MKPRNKKALLYSLIVVTGLPILWILGLHASYFWVGVAKPKDYGLIVPLPRMPEDRFMEELLEKAEVFRGKKDYQLDRCREGDGKGSLLNACLRALDEHRENLKNFDRFLAQDRKYNLERFPELGLHTRQATFDFFELEKQKNSPLAPIFVLAKLYTLRGAERIRQGLVDEGTADFRQAFQIADFLQQNNDMIHFMIGLKIQLQVAQAMRDHVHRKALTQTMTTLIPESASILNALQIVFGAEWIQFTYAVMSPKLFPDSKALSATVQLLGIFSGSHTTHVAAPAFVWFQNRVRRPPLDGKLVDKEYGKSDAWPNYWKDLNWLTLLHNPLGRMAGMFIISPYWGKYVGRTAESIDEMSEIRLILLKRLGQSPKELPIRLKTGVKMEWNEFQTTSHSN